VNPSNPSNQRPIIRAAGALLWRRSSSGYEIAVIHRSRYNDWTLPKGKLKKGESWQAAALREVKEETGYEVTLLNFAGAIAYLVDDRPKVVRFWHMTVDGEPSAELDDEVAEVVWLAVEAAQRRLQYPLEQALLDVWRGPGEPAD